MKHIFFISFFLWNIIHQTDANIYVHLHVEKSAYRNISQLQISPVVSTSKLKRDESRYTNKRGWHQSNSSGGSFFPWHLIRADYFVKFVIPWRGRGFVIPWRNKLSNNVTSNNPRQWLVRQYHRQMAVSIELLSKCASSIFDIRYCAINLCAPLLPRIFQIRDSFPNFFTRIWIRIWKIISFHMFLSSDLYLLNLENVNEIS